MATVPDHLVPQDGLTNSSVRWYRMEILHDEGMVRFFFAFTDENKQKIADYPIDLPLSEAKNGGFNAMIAEAHRCMNDNLRQWLYVNDTVYRAYSDVE
ncbi:hypothetical protein [Bradyrhizobium sp. CCGUVB23]|uniref:hypothetical protein n=1 Tax=Bradyrhizobium sp. CCGUVB23 TaxID=2949630 RepID=UPI0020B1A43C|nr:hypothetical protein [Bradyrhizobium sp. CCGUVB23]MCP3459627.1 hypothetical protein [Bradyrhizobium sp. CCGUVB23]